MSLVLVLVLCPAVRPCACCFACLDVGCIVSWIRCAAFCCHPGPHFPAGQLCACDGWQAGTASMAECRHHVLQTSRPLPPPPHTHTLLHRLERDSLSHLTAPPDTPADSTASGPQPSAPSLFVVLQSVLSGPHVLQLNMHDLAAPRPANRRAHKTQQRTRVCGWALALAACTSQSTFVAAILAPMGCCGGGRVCPGLLRVLQPVCACCAAGGSVHRY